MNRRGLEYIWVDQHILFKNMEFNFSNDFNIDFDRDSNKLHIKKKKNLLRQLYPKNIENIHAIVGENGAGKTQLLNVIEDVIGAIANRMRNRGSDIPLNFGNEKMHEFIAIFIKNEKLYLIKNFNQIEIENNTEYEIVKIYTNNDDMNREEREIIDNFELIKYSSTFDEKVIYNKESKDIDFSVVTDIKDTFIKLQEVVKENFMECVKSYKNFLILDNKNDIRDDNSNINDIMKQNDKRWEDQYLRRSAENIISPTQIYRNISLSKDIKWIYSIFYNNKKLSKIPYELDLKLSINTANKEELTSKYPDSADEIENILNIIDKKFIDPSFCAIFTLLLYEILKLLARDGLPIRMREKIEKNIRDRLDINEVLSWIENLLDNIEVKFNDEGYESIKDVQKFMNEMTHLTDKLSNPSKAMKSIKNLIEFFTLFCTETDGNEFVTDSYDFNKTYCDISRDYNKLIYIITADETNVNTEFIDITINYNNFSAGEIMRFKIFSRLHMGILKRINKYNNGFTIWSEKQIEENKKKSKECLYLLLLDEPELTMHPKWQRDFVSSLTEFLKDNFNDYKFQIVFTTNSPMTLTEVFHTNIIKLKKNEQRNTTTTEEVVKPTLGANLYDLYKDSFFFGDSFCGSYINNVIDMVIKKLEKEKLTDQSIEEIDYLIGLIGDPVISMVLKDKLKNKNNNNDNNKLVEDKMKNVLNKFDDEISEDLAKKLMKELINELKNE